MAHFKINHVHGLDSGLAIMRRMIRRVEREVGYVLPDIAGLNCKFADLFESELRFSYGHGHNATCRVLCGGRGSVFTVVTAHDAHRLATRVDPQ